MTADISSSWAINGDFTPVLAKDSRSFSLIDCIWAGVDWRKRSFGRMRILIDTWQGLNTLRSTTGHTF